MKTRDGKKCTVRTFRAGRVLRWLVLVRVVVDPAVPERKRGAIEEAIRAGVAALPADSFVVVTRLPSGRLTVFINHMEEPELLTRLETALSQLR